MSFNFDNTVFNQALIFNKDAVISQGGKTLDEYGLPTPDRRQATTPIEIIEAISYDIRELAKLVAGNEPSW